MVAASRCHRSAKSPTLREVNLAQHRTTPKTTQHKILLTQTLLKICSLTINFHPAHVLVVLFLLQAAASSKACVRSPEPTKVSSSFLHFLRQTER
jgi:hypothetical protein